MDGELDLARTLEVEDHLRACASCAHAYRSLQGQRSALRTDTLYYRAPAGLEARLRAALPQQSQPRRITLIPAWRSFALAAALAAVFLLGWGLARLRPASPAGETLAQAVVAAHVRSLLAAQPVDIVSSNHHQVKPWFNGKLDFAPPVSDLTDVGFPLYGGRLDYLDGKRVAALVYKHGRHVINLFIWPAPNTPNRADQITTQQGYHLISGTRAGMDYWIISDMDPGELQQFANRVESSL